MSARPASARSTTSSSPRAPGVLASPRGVPRWPGNLLPEPFIPYGTPIKRPPPNADGHLGGGPFGASHDLQISRSAQYQPIALRPQSARDAREMSRLARANALAYLYSKHGEQAASSSYAASSGASSARSRVPSATAQRAALRPQSARGHAARLGHAQPITLGEAYPPTPVDALQHGRPSPIYETHRIHQANCVLNYLSISEQRPRHFHNPSALSGKNAARADPAGRLAVYTFAPRPPHVPEWRPRVRGPVDGRGRVGRSRGLGGNPTAWRTEGPDPEAHDYGVSEQQRAYPPRLPPAGPGVNGGGIPTEVWTGTEHCVHDYTHKLALTRTSDMRYA